MRLITTLLLIVALAVAPRAAAGAVEDAIAAFDSAPSAANANSFFNHLAEEEFLDENIHFAMATPADSLNRTVWYWASEWFYDCQDYDSALAYALKALPLYRYDDCYKADCLNITAIIYLRLGDFANAADYARRSVAIELRGDDPDRISSSMNTLAGIYLAADQLSDAECYILQGLEYAARANNDARHAILLGMASEVYHKLGDNERALAYARRAFDKDSVADRTYRMAIRRSQMASALAGLGRNAEAEAAYRAAIPVLREARNFHSLAIDLNQLGFVLLALDRHSEAIPLFSEAATLLADMGDLYNCLHSHRGLYESYWSINPDSARIELTRFNTLRDSLYSTATAETLARYTAEFGNEQLQIENENIRDAHRRDIFIGIAIIIAIVAVALVLLYRHRCQRRALIREIADIKRSINSTVPITNTPVDATESFRQAVVNAVNAGIAAGNLGVAHLASQLNMSEQTFRRRVREATGDSPKMFITAIQMERAARLICEDIDRPISDIASLCGFDDASAFSHAFKRVYGCSPSQYRNSH
ncbi:MAG: helix-turn-helix domain-containing protein [Muribaculaceae bacterium]